ncbi:MAG TPA: YceI family protein [Bacteroidota bacterium]|nr:YceI family protein [Bacteroidota bacterium]
MKRNIALVLLLALSLAGASAQTTWKGDKAHSTVRFSVTHMLINEVSGRFTDFDVTLTQGKDDFSGSTVEAVIKTASVTTDNEMRDNHLKTDDFFNVEKYPTISFKSTSFEKTGENTYKIAGNLTIRDVTKPVVLDAKYTGSLTDQRGNTKAGFRATTTVNRFDYGVKWNRTLDQGGLIVSKEVEITLLFEMNKKAPGDAEHK